MRPVHVAQRRHVHHIGVSRIHPDTCDLPRIAQPYVRPGLARIGRFIHSVAKSNLRTDVRLPRAYVNHVRVRGRHRDRANRRDLLLVEYRRPRSAGIARLPYPAAHAAEVEGGAVPRHAADRRHSAPAEWPDIAPLKLIVKVRRQARGMRRGAQQNSGKTHFKRLSVSPVGIPLHAPPRIVLVRTSANPSRGCVKVCTLRN